MERVVIKTTTSEKESLDIFSHHLKFNTIFKTLTGIDNGTRRVSNYLNEVEVLIIEHYRLFFFTWERIILKLFLCGTIYPVWNCFLYF